MEEQYTYDGNHYKLSLLDGGEYEIYFHEDLTTMKIPSRPTMAIIQALMERVEKNTRSVHNSAYESGVYDGERQTNDESWDAGYQEGYDEGYSVAEWECKE